MANLSKIKREELLAFIDKLKEQNKDDESIRSLNEIANALTEKKYGLVWEKHTEKVDEMLEHNIPVFEEVEERKIKVDDSNEYNFLLEGDNLHSLKLLEKTHKGKIDVIYIDPPYNTGNKDFIYNDSYVDKTDGYSHSKWLSFMSERLEIAKNLLSDEGVIFISIDDKEQAQLKLLCDEVFGAENFVTNIHWKRSESQNNNAKQLSIVGEFILCYAMNKTHNYFNKISLKETAIKEYRYTDELTGKLFRRGTIVDNSRGKHIIEIKSPNGITKTIKSIRTKEFFDEENKKGNVYWTKTGTPYLKIFLEKSEGQICNNWFDNDGVNEDASDELKVLNIDFDFSKPKKMILKLLKLKGDKNVTILDFFAGSGTTGHAVMQLNKEDGGNRKYILCTNNENNICEEVTYKRLKNIQEELPHNLKYLKTDFIPKFDNEDDEESLSDRLINYIKPLIELEYMCEIDDKNKLILLDEFDFEDFINKANEGATIFRASDVFLSGIQMKELENKGIKIIDIPDYYFKNELMEVGEL